MKKLKVIAFFILLLMFVGFLTYLEVKRFGSLTGFFTTEKDSSPKEGGNLDTVILGEIIFFIALLFITALVIRFVLGFSERDRAREISYKVENQRRLIPVDLEHPREEEES